MEILSAFARALVGNFCLCSLVLPPVLRSPDDEAGWASRQIRRCLKRNQELAQTIAAEQRLAIGAGGENSRLGKYSPLFSVLSTDLLETIGLAAWEMCSDGVTRAVQTRHIEEDGVATWLRGAGAGLPPQNCDPDLPKIEN